MKKEKENKDQKEELLEVLKKVISNETVERITITIKPNKTNKQN